MGYVEDTPCVLEPLTMADTDSRNIEGSHGARYFKCALQVNPYAYARDYAHRSEFEDQRSYNTAIIKACRSSGVKAIAITDHYRVSTSDTLAKLAAESDIAVFPGFEAVTKDGVHLLCLFDPTTSFNKVDRLLGNCGIHRDQSDSPIGKYDVLDFLKEA